MDTVEEETYVFLRMADGDISEAFMALDHLRRTRSQFIRLTLIRQATVSYCRPFTKCRGSFKKKHQLDAGNFVKQVERHFPICDNPCVTREAASDPPRR